MAKILSFAAARRDTASTRAPDVNPARLWIERRKPGQSRVSATGHAQVVARLLGYVDLDTCPWHALGYVDVAGLRASLLLLVEADELVPGSANQYLMAAKGIMAEVWRLGVANGARYLDADALKLIEDVPRLPGRHRRRDRRVLTDDEAATLLASCAADPTPRGARDAAIVAIGLACGLRASEYAALALADYDRDEVRLRIPQIKVEVSEDAVWLPFGPPASVYLDRWLAWRGHAPGALLPRMERGGMGLVQALDPGSITEILRGRGEACGIGHVTAHDLRATFVTRVLRVTGDLAMAAKLARHRSTVTTALYYDKRDLADMRETLARVPWPGRDVVETGQPGNEVTEKPETG